MPTPHEIRQLRRDVLNLAEDIFRAATSVTCHAHLRDAAKHLRAALAAVAGKRPPGRPPKQRRQDDDDDCEGVYDEFE